MPPTVIDIFIEGRPVPKARPRVYNGHGVTPTRTRRAEASLLAQARPYAPQEPLRGPLAVEVTSYLPVPSKATLKKRGVTIAACLTGAHLPTGTPDADNLAKLATDALNGVMWVDDGQIVRLVSEKRYGLKPGTRIIIRTL
jgi:Holliday junction resolvase RusA-like endonuclease